MALLSRSSDREGIARARYSFAKDGGAVGDIVLSGDGIPKGAIVLDVLIKVDTAPDSAGHTATIAVKVQGAADLQAAKVVAEAPWSTAGAKRGTLDADTAPILLTARRRITATVAVQALTAGKFSVYVRYLRPNA
jgi:hypothetical protein